MKTVIEVMWEALAGYQPQATAQGHGETWAAMCREKTSEAAVAAYYVATSYSAMVAACSSASAVDAANAADASLWSKHAIARINEAKGKNT